MRILPFKAIKVDVPAIGTKDDGRKEAKQARTQGQLERTVFEDWKTDDVMIFENHPAITHPIYYST